MIGHYRTTIGFLQIRDSADIRPEAGLAYRGSDAISSTKPTVSGPISDP